MKTTLLIFILCVFNQVTAQAQVQVNEPDPLLICEENPTGFAIFDLTIREGQISDVPTEVEFTYYETASDAQNKTNQIANPYEYQNFTNPQTIYVRVEDLNTGEYAVVELELIIDELPLINTEVSELYAYEIIEPYFGIFDLTEKIPEIIGDQTGLEVTFYESPFDAEDKINVIEEPTVYYNVHNPTTIWARVENSSGCFSIAVFDIIPELVLSISESSFNNFALYPNPSNGILNVVPGLKEDFNLTVYNIKGELMLSENVQAIGSGNFKVNLSSLPSGIYLITLTAEHTTFTKKIIKE